MKKIDVVEIKEYSYPHKTNKKQKNKIEDFYKENSRIIFTKLVVDENIPLKDLIEKITKEFDKQRKALEKSMHNFSFMKLFSFVAIKHQTFVEQLNNLDVFYSKLKEDYDNLVLYCKKLQVREEATQKDYLEVFYKLVEIDMFINGLNDDIAHLKHIYYPEMKVAAHNLCDTKTAKEIDELYDNINNYLKEFKDMQEAFDYICYNSGGLITDTVKTFVESLRKNGRNVSERYFLDSDVVIAFNYIEWINLMKRMQFIKYKFRNDDYSITFLENYKNLEVAFAIILIFNAVVECNNR